MNPNISISGTELIWAISSITVFIIGAIVLGRWYVSRFSSADLATKYEGKKQTSPLASRNKYPDVDVLRHSGFFLRIGLIISIGLIVLAFNWTSFEEKVDIPEGALEMEVDLEIEPPQTTAEPPPPPPPPPPVIEEVPNELILEAEDDFEFVDQSIDANTAVDAPEPTYTDTKEEPLPPPPPPPPPKVEEPAEIFKVVEEMPRFPGCEDLTTSIAEKKACADQKMLEFLYQNIKYPAIARENNISGTVVVRFVVNTDGSITDAEVVREIGGGCGDEALRVVALMNEMDKKWAPGRQRGKAVRVMFNLPVKFVLRET